MKRLLLNPGMASETLTIEYDDDTFEYTVESHGGVNQIHMYVKELWWGFPTDSGIEEYAAALEWHAKRLEALKADGWELIDTDGEHLHFEKRLEDERDS